MLDEEMHQAIELSKIEAEQRNQEQYSTFFEEKMCSASESSIHLNDRFDQDSENEYLPEKLDSPKSAERYLSDEPKKQEPQERTPLIDVVDSFNCVPDTLMMQNKQKLFAGEEKPKFKFVSTPLRKKADRLRLLQGHDCKDCREFYQGDNLTDKELTDLLNKCSKHRSKDPPPQQSPQIRWKLELEEDGPNDKTQIPSPLKTRERRTLLRKL